MAGSSFPTVVLQPGGVTPEDVLAVARQEAMVELSATTRQGLVDSRRRIEELASSAAPVYGISTGFGALAPSRAGGQCGQPLRPPRRFADRGVRSHG
ncbi:MAG TPA: aromatic amino acid lyase [Acidimicrobiales bacterium]|jgi:histidine ammonia-lyase|nr:aromatic amino acid lyase [Acidimicrobiales bacterium]